MEKATIFLRELHLNSNFKLEGGNFKGTLIKLLREYDNYEIPVCEHKWKEYEDEWCNARFRCIKCKKII